MSAVVVTSCFGGYDTLRPPVEQDVPTTWVAYVDQPTPTVAPWVIVPIDSSGSNLHPRMGAKRAKMTRSLDPGMTDVVWIDANMEVTSPSFVRETLAARRNGIAVWRHPQRDCIYDEARASLRLCPDKYADQPLIEQVKHYYRAHSHPPHAGLYACGTVAWDWSDPHAHKVAEAWWTECERWSYQDQLSLPVVLRRLGVKPGVFPLGQIDLRGEGWIGNRWLRIWPHLSDD